jgi:hypothetical protein
VGSSAQAHIFRSYDNTWDKNEKWVPLNPGFANVERIWEVARATTSAPLFFPPTIIDDTEYRDGGMLANNPSQFALQEVASLQRRKLNNICLVSIGSGLRPQEKKNGAVRSRTFTFIREWKNTIEIMRKQVTDTERTSRTVFGASLASDFPYFRFNVDLPRDILPDEYVGEDEKSGKEGGTFGAIAHYTKKYLERPEIRKNLAECAETIISLVIERKKDAGL